MPSAGTSTATPWEQQTEPAATTNSNAERNAGQVAGACVMMLKGGPIGIPLMLMCLPFVPIVAVATALGEAFPASHDGAGAPEFAYPSSAHLPRAEAAQYVNGGRGSSGFAYPNSEWGCSGSCR